MPRKQVKTRPTKDNVLTIRVHEKIKFGLELVARKQHRNMTTVLSWLIEKLLKDPEDGLGGKLDLLWDPREPYRFVNLGLYAPELMTYNEELLWKYICEFAYFSKGKKSDNLYNSVWEHWDILKQVIEDDVSPYSKGKGFCHWDEAGESERAYE